MLNIAVISYYACDSDQLSIGFVSVSRQTMGILYPFFEKTLSLLLGLI